jgi:hypothetical protein
MAGVYGCGIDEASLQMFANLAKLPKVRVKYEEDIAPIGGCDGVGGNDGCPDTD